MEKIIVIKFKSGGKTYYFSHDGLEHKSGDGVIVECASGQEYATIVIPYLEVSEEKLVAPLKPIVRIATEDDKEKVEKNKLKRNEVIPIFLEKVAKLELPMKFIDCEVSFDGQKVLFYFSAEHRVDFRELVKELSQAIRMRIELRQIGIRDEIKILGGLAPCGRECCCSGCMKDFQKVTIKMVKNQGLTLNPQKISGLCGRLMCCLAYENDYYADAVKKVPKIGTLVGSPDGKGIVVNVDMLKMIVRIRIEQPNFVVYRDFPVDKLEFEKGENNEND